MNKAQIIQKNSEFAVGQINSVVDNLLMLLAVHDSELYDIKMLTDKVAENTAALELVKQRASLTQAFEDISQSRFANAEQELKNAKTELDSYQKQEKIKAFYKFKEILTTELMHKYFHGRLTGFELSVSAKGCSNLLESVAYITGFAIPKIQDEHTFNFEMVKAMR